MIRLLFLSIAIFPIVASAATDREAFAKEDRPIEGVPVEAFELANPDLQIEVWAQSPLIYCRWRWMWMHRGGFG